MDNMRLQEALAVFFLTIVIGSIIAIYIARNEKFDKYDAWATFFLILLWSIIGAVLEYIC